MSSVAVTALSVTVGLYFCLVGALKVYPGVNEETHKEFKKMYISHSRLFPLAKYTGYRPHPRYYRLTVGYLEILCGLVLAIVPVRWLKTLANILLLVACGLSVYTHWIRRDGFERMSGNIVMAMLLLCRFVIHWQFSKRTKQPPVQHGQGEEKQKKEK